MIGKVGRWRHVVVGVAVAGVSVLAGLGVIAGGSHPERFDAKTVVVANEGLPRIRVTEYVDIDFGSEDRHGYERLVPNDFGVPTDVAASSPDADATLEVLDMGGSTRIRLGDPDRTFTGQHRYVLSYTLPAVVVDASGPDPQLVVDLVAPPDGVFPGDRETGRFEVVVTGFELTDLRCDVGSLRSTGGCELAAAADGTYRAVLEPLPTDAGLTVGGTIVDTADVVAIDAPAVPERRPEPDRGLVALGFAALGTVASVPVYVWARRRGRNEVFAGGAADAAFGSLPPPGTVRRTASGTAASTVTMVADDDMADLATIEFAPPKGITPWEASALLFEQVDNDTVEAWFSGLVGREALVAEDRTGKLVLSSGPRRGELEPVDAALLDGVLALGDPYVTGTYDSKFAAAWTAIHHMQRDRIRTSGWWKRLPPTSSFLPGGKGTPVTFIVMMLFVIAWLGGASTALLGLFRGWPLGIAIGAGFPALIALFMYRVLLPARTAHGSALALQTESFRRFLHASEGRHVEWAWSHGLLREYSAWAVALREADAWSDALERANVPEPARLAATPLVVHSGMGSMRSSITAPSSSGSGGGGGSFGGGGVGGGGGGGSSGSW